MVEKLGSQQSSEPHDVKIKQLYEPSWVKNLFHVWVDIKTLMK